ncbi:YjjG family noncanonical pyrimidine nucleotidase [Parapedobacter sp. ISTM3]|uniref:Putative hydrolase of the HAD superfamily n=1 Tax=Parapedobacter luteus TaxID=623280 RepID=A0A1T5BNQ9_9SPHI|nr:MULTISPECIES: YjjG family noncanonical pyrimidine nucleotidase [Parapedobacter]MBK1439374.1 YjjG family noncanonical pyrimidine nucleotidase [Parapedobacter sp. ISTM3]SKB48942.1 putative hydrolase of the HAD superfamily [Parapedobacter luteus]
MGIKNKKDIFFDLDHTLWDFEKNAEETLLELFDTYRFSAFGFGSAELFIETYNRNNHRLWASYHHGKITKAELREARFADTFSELGVDPRLFPKAFETDYLRLCPQKTNLFPHVHETLGYLQEKYTLHLISNGFGDAAETKVTKCNLKKYFTTIVISETVGVHKPHPQIFHYAVANAKTAIPQSVMIGDSLDADIRGALNVGMDAIFFNPKKNEVPTDVKQSITTLDELKALL